MWKEKKSYSVWIQGSRIRATCVSFNLSFGDFKSQWYRYVKPSSILIMFGMTLV